MARWPCVWCALWLALDLAGLPGRAFAFGDPFRFADPAADGGGGGRWFTGSPADGFTCDVCHEGATNTPIVVEGLPAMYAPGATYSLSVSWPATALHVTALIELSDALGRGAGSSQVAEVGLAPGETCEPVEQGVPAGIVLAGQELGLQDARQVVAMQDCGGHVLHWTWTAPVSDVGAVLFAGGLVEPDQQKNAEGDHSTRLFRVIAGPTGESSVQRVTGTCAWSPTAPASSTWSCLGLALLATFACRRRLFSFAGRNSKIARAMSGHDEPAAPRSSEP